MAKLVSKIVELWHDRKRILGMPLSFTRYALSEDRLFLKRGFLNVHQDEIVLYRVRDLRVSQTLWQRVFGVGTVTVISTDKSIPELALKNIRQPNEVKELIHEHVDMTKTRNIFIASVILVAGIGGLLFRFSIGNADISTSGVSIAMILGTPTNKAKED